MDPKDMEAYQVISFDVESTGLDVYHGARPFFLTTCSDDGRLKWWEWDVDPLTRKVQIGYKDIAEITERLTLTDDRPVPGKWYKFCKAAGLENGAPIGIVRDKLTELGKDAEVRELENVTGCTLVAQNSKFDVAMLRALFNDVGQELHWDWSRTHDTLIAGHLLASNKPHDLTSMAIQYLEIGRAHV